MLSDEELNEALAKYENWIKSLMSYYGDGTTPLPVKVHLKTVEIIQEILANRTNQKPAAGDPDMIEVRLPVIVFPDKRSLCLKHEYCDDAANLNDAMNRSYATPGSHVVVVTTSLPQPKRREPIEVRGEVEG